MRDGESVTFAGGRVDRAAHLRCDDGALAAIWAAPEARVLLLWRGKTLMGDGALGWIGTDHPLAASRRGDAVFLGRLGGAGRFALDMSGWTPDALPGTLGAFADPSEQHHPELPGLAFAELRRVMPILSATEAELAATARALIGWHGRHGHCAVCGAAADPLNGGWQSRCPVCGADHFPRTDPVVIMAITRGNSVLLGRAPVWPDGMYSLLAGFVEPGESLEAATRREVAEEAGITVGAVGYLASQPWPFPASLMIGCWGRALTTAIARDPEELDDALWLSREDMARAFAGAHPRVAPPREGSIARFLMWHWLADRLRPAASAPDG